MKKLAIITLILGITMLVGCATPPSDSDDVSQPAIASVTEESLQQSIIPGKTTQQDIIAQFGEPTEKGEDWATFWRYDHRKSNANLGDLVGGVVTLLKMVKGISDIAKGESSSHTTSDTPELPTFTQTTLLFRFNDDGTVDEYQLDISEVAE